MQYLSFWRRGFNKPGGAALQIRLILSAWQRTYGRMRIQIDDIVTLPAYAPYPRYGRVIAREDGDRVRVTDVHCGDPRCTSEHRHDDQVWRVPDLEAAQAYQARARWEAGRKGSPNAPVLS